VKAHPHLLDEYKKKKSSFQAQKQEQSEQKTAQPLSLSQKQPSISEFLKKKQKWPPNSPQSKELDKRVLEMIAIGNYPFTIVQELGFQRVVECLNPQATLKSEKFYRDKLNPTYESLCEKVKEIVSVAKSISFTTDIWTNKAKSESLISFTAHYVDFSTGSRPKIILAAQPLHSDHTGEVICDFFQTTLQTWNIQSNKVHGLVHDNAKNMCRAVALTGCFKDIRCFAHTLQLAINDSISSQRAIVDLLAIARSIVGHFSRSEQARRRLEEIQDSQNFPKLEMVQSVPTRWNSSYLMLERLIKQKDALALYESRFNLPDSITPNQWKIAENVCNLLFPFYDITKIISRDDITCSVVIPFVKNLIKHLSNQDQPDTQFHGIGKMKAILQKSLEDRFCNIEADDTLQIATFLDPRFKDKYLNGLQLEILKERLQQELEPLPKVPPPELPEQDEKSEQQIKRPKTLAIWDLESSYNEHEIVPLNEQVQTFKKSETIDQIEKYVSSPKVERKTNIFQWWADSPYAKLKIAAMKYLSAPATSIPSEQLFSTAGEIYDDNRYRLKGENVEKLLFLNKNLPLFNFKY